jgi:hypothetical protein
MQMTRTTPLMRLYRMDRARRRLVLRAAATLTAASAAVALLPFRRAIAFGSAPLGAPAGPATSDWIWAVEAAARRLPWPTKCIQKGLAAQRLLRRSGTDARLHYGARHHPDTGKLQAHVWITVDGQAVIGGEEAEGFAELESYR